MDKTHDTWVFFENDFRERNFLGMYVANRRIDIEIICRRITEMVNEIERESGTVWYTQLTCTEGIRSFYRKVEKAKLLKTL